MSAEQLEENEIPNDVVEQELTDEVPQEESSEDRARRMGWKPQEEYQGAGDWVDADEFIKRGENDPIELRKQNKALERSLQKMEKTLDSIKSHQDRQVEAERKKAFDDGRRAYEQEIKRATEEGDYEGVQKAIKGRDELNRRETESTTTAPSQDMPDIFPEWRKRNSWFGTDDDMTEFAQNYCNKVANLPAERQLEEVEKKMRQMFPHKFGQSRTPPAMPGGRNALPRNELKYGTYEALKPEFKAECDRNVKQGTSKEVFLRYCTPEMFKVKPEGEE